jgi:uncharacterized paraquat-inducible protein A
MSVSQSKATPWVLMALNFGCLLLLWPGLTMPVLTIEAGITLGGITQTLFYQQQSILESIDALQDADSHLAAVLVFLFSVCVPITKAAAIMISLLMPKKWEGLIRRWVSLISKWAMADVFVMGLFIAFLASNSSEFLTAKLEIGFYYFSAYCVCSVLVFQIIDRFYTTSSLSFSRSDLGK